MSYERDTDQQGLAGDREASDRGSALVMALFVLALLTSIGVALLVMANTDVRMNQADLLAKKVFYNAEAGLEDGRETLRATNAASATPTTLDDELATAAGTNAAMNFDVNNLAPVYDANGKVTSFTGYGDDVPLRAMTSFGGGSYAAFVTNDPLDANTPLHDTNDRVLITSIGTGANRAMEIVQAIVEREPFPALPSAITMLGPSAGFDGGSSNAKTYTGDDCAGATGYSGIPGLYVPTVGTTGSASTAVAQAGVQQPSNYTSGPDTGTSTVASVSGSMSPLYNDCSYLQTLAAMIKVQADYVCTTASPCTGWSSTNINTITYVDGDFDIAGGKGLLWVTGDVTVHGNTDWEGVIFAVGKGVFHRSGGGNGHTWGGVLVANIDGPDGVYGTGDDCTGGTGGFGPTTFDISGSGNHDLAYCSDAISQTTTAFPLKVVDFRQR